MSKKLKIAKSKKTPSLRIWCPGCSSELRENSICKANGKSLNTCPNIEKHKYRAVVYEPGSKKRRSKEFDTRDNNEAIELTVQFRKEVKTGINKPEIKPQEKPIPVKPQEKQEENQLSVLQAGTHYLMYLEGKRGPEHMVRDNRSIGHIKDVKKSIIQFGQSLHLRGLPPDELEAKNVTRVHVGYYHSYLNEKGYGSRIYNRRMSNVGALFNYLSDFEGIKIENPFKTVQKKRAITNPKSINPSQYRDVMSVLTRENGVQVLSTGEKKYHFFEELKYAIPLGLMTGVRREQLVLLNYSNINESENVLLSQNLKVNRAKNDGETRVTAIPIPPMLWKLLREMGYEKYKNTDKYLLCPESKIERITLMSNISKAFTHYAKKAGLPSDISFRHLRKSYITQIQLVAGEQTHLISNHANSKTISDHYLDKTLLATQISKKTELFEEYGETMQKVEQIKKVRQKKQKEILIER